jgi:hypothetical protein
MKFKDIIETLFGFSAPTWYRWKKENRKIVDLVEKYLSEQDLEEFLMYGTIEKLEFANIQNYSMQAASFVKVLNELRHFIEVYTNEEYRKLHEEYGDFDDELDYMFENEITENIIDLQELRIPEEDDLFEMLYSIKFQYAEGLRYLALVFSKGKFDTNEDFTRDNLSQQIISFYDAFVLQEEHKSRKIKSSSLGTFVETFRKEYPKFNYYEGVLFTLYETNFISLVKHCLRFHPEDAEIALWFCIQFNLCKYNSSQNIKDIYHQVAHTVYDSQIGSVRSIISLEKLNEQIKNIQNN